MNKKRLGEIRAMLPERWSYKCEDGRINDNPCYYIPHLLEYIAVLEALYSAVGKHLHTNEDMFRSGVITALASIEAAQKEKKP